MHSVVVDGVTFEFPSDWAVSKYDDWSFYRNQFCKMQDGIKALDLFVIEDEKVLWLIEVKDYRRNRREKKIPLCAEVSKKVIDSLSGLLPAKANANDLDEKAFAKSALACRRLRVVLHLEQPVNGNKLFPRAFNPAIVQQKMRQMLKPIDPHPIVAESANMHGLQWLVRA